MPKRTHTQEPDDDKPWPPERNASTPDIGGVVITPEDWIEIKSLAASAYQANQTLQLRLTALSLQAGAAQPLSGVVKPGIAQGRAPGVRAAGRSEA